MVVYKVREKECVSVDALQRRVGAVLVEVGAAVPVQQLALAGAVVIRVAVVGPATTQQTIHKTTNSETILPQSINTASLAGTDGHGRRRRRSAYHQVSRMLVSRSFYNTKILTIPFTSKLIQAFRLMVELRTHTYMNPRNNILFLGSCVS